MDETRDWIELLEGDEEPLPDVRELSDDDLHELIANIGVREYALSCRRSVLQGKLDVLRAEKIARLRQPPGHVDVERVAEALLLKWRLHDRAAAD
jgi:hypothetical protein